MSYDPTGKTKEHLDYVRRMIEHVPAACKEKTEEHLDALVAAAYADGQADARKK